MLMSALLHSAIQCRRSILETFHNYVTDQELATLSKYTQPRVKYTTSTLHHIVSSADSRNTHILDLTFIPQDGGNIYDWINLIMQHIILKPTPTSMRLINIWVSPSHLFNRSSATVSNFLEDILPESWVANQKNIISNQ